MAENEKKKEESSYPASKEYKNLTFSYKSLKEMRIMQSILMSEAELDDEEIKIKCGIFTMNNFSVPKGDNAKELFDVLTECIKNAKEAKCGIEIKKGKEVIATLYVTDGIMAHIYGALAKCGQIVRKIYESVKGLVYYVYDSFRAVFNRNTGVLAVPQRVYAAFSDADKTAIENRGIKVITVG